MERDCTAPKHCRYTGLGCNTHPTQSFGLFFSLRLGTVSGSHSVAEKTQRCFSQSQSTSWLFWSLQGSRTLSNGKSSHFHNLC